MLGGPIRWPARDYLLCCLTVIVRNCRKLYYVRDVSDRNDQQVPDYEAGQVRPNPVPAVRKKQVNFAI